MRECAELRADVLGANWEGSGGRGELQATRAVFSSLALNLLSLDPQESPNVRGEAGLLPPINAKAEVSFLSDLGHLQQWPVVWSKVVWPLQPCGGSKNHFQELSFHLSSFLACETGEGLLRS